MSSVMVNKYFKANGFSLVELVIVLLILAVLAVTAMPKVINLQRDARIQSLTTVKGAVDSMVKLVEAKSRLENIAEGSVLAFESQNMLVRDFSPIAHWNNNFRYILELPGGPFGFTSVGALCNQAFCGVGNQSNWPANNSTYNNQIANLTNNQKAVFIWPEGFRLADECYMYFVEKRANTINSEVLTGVMDTGC